MKNHFKKQFDDLIRYQTSLGRNLEKGLRLDRNEKVSNFSDDIISDIFTSFKPYSLSASPEPDKLYTKIAKSVRISENKIFITNGITEGIRILYETLTNPGQNVVVLDPTYPFYSIYAEMYQVEYRKFGFAKDLKPDWDSFDRNMDENTTMVMIPNPNLPIESVMTIDQLREIAQKCEKNKTVLVIDEAYHFFGGPSAIQLIDEFENVVVMRTFSKAYGLAGIRLGFMMSSVDNIEYLSKTRSLVESNTLTMSIAEYMLDHPEIMEAHVKEVKEGSQFLQDALSEMGLNWYGGNYTNGILIFLNQKAETEDVIGFLKKRNIYIRGAFFPPFDKCIRVSIGSRSIMEVFIAAFKEWFSKR
ncbi:MAG: histidinol-phosphate transaminase [Pseudomonadota bacterium]